ncbi:MAG: DUF3179 domain-containing protein [Anaerolineales bacterium]
MIGNIRFAVLTILSGLAVAACAGGTPPVRAPDASGSAGTPSTSDMSSTPIAAEGSRSEAPPPSGAAREFRTDFSRHTVDYAEILSGGPPKDGIPAIDHPRFITAAEADEWLEPAEPVIFLESGGDARAYPLQIFMWHEIVNDVVGGVPVLVTFCPLCNTAIAFERTVQGQVLDFGTTGRLRFSNLIMYDRQTETWWQQASGEAIAGELTGTRLKFLPAPIISWSDFRTSHGEGKVLSRETGYSRPYGQNPYAGYDDIDSSPFLYRGPETPGQLRPMERVLAVELNGDVVAFPYSLLEELRVAVDTIGGEEVVVLWEPGTASALDSRALALGRDVGTANAFSRVVDGRSLTFAHDGSSFIDNETGTRWDILGRALEGELLGKRLTPVVAINHFWFSWVAFQPGTRVFEP